VSPEQVVVPVVYGQQVPEEVVPALDGAPDSALDGALDGRPDGGSDGGLDTAEARGFKVRLDNFEGPFDLLLQLIGKHKLDVTEIALHQVTDDFIAYIRAMGDDWDLEETSEFLLVAATLLDLKAARLLPSAEVEDEEDLALLEARDLLFARLLQYKAFKEAAAVIAELEGAGAKRWPRAVSMEPRYAEALPDLVLGIGPERLFKLALKQFMPKPGPPQVSITHIHQVRVSVPEHAQLLRERLRRAGSATFTLLVADCDTTLEVVARFLALLELYRQNLIDFEQPVSLDELTVRWIGGDDGGGELEVDDYEGTRPDPDAPPATPVTDADLTGDPFDGDSVDSDPAGGDSTHDDSVDADLAGGDPFDDEPVDADLSHADPADDDAGNDLDRAGGYSGGGLDVAGDESLGASDTGGVGSVVDVAGQPVRDIDRGDEPGLGDEAGLDGAVPVAEGILNVSDAGSAGEAVVEEQQ
jgi:segregation and condensation protein A